MIFFICFVAAIILLIIIGVASAISKFDGSVRQLYLESKPINTFYTTDQITMLPLPVQNYFRHVLKDGQRYISYVRLRHHGRFKTAATSKWAAITGQEYFTVSKPGFVWKGTIGNITAIDSFIAGKGNLSVFALKFIRVMSGRGVKFSQGELLRWLGECVWFPTALLPNENLHWEEVDATHARLVYQYRKLLVYYLVTFNPSNEIEQMETKRYMGGKELESWVGKISNYKPINGMMIPMTMQAIWKLPDLDFTYAVFYLSDIEYDKPKLYK